MANVLVLTESSPGAPPNRGVNGDLCNLLDWALPQKGWAIEYTSGNARVYRPASGNRFRLHVNHDSAVSGRAGAATVRGCENASSATVLIDPFPQVAQVANSSSQWSVSNTNDTTARGFYLYVWETGVIYFSNVASTANEYAQPGMFFDAEGEHPLDVYATCLFTRASPGAGTGSVVISSLVNTTSNLFFCRDVTGATKSTRGAFFGSGANFGNLTGGVSARSGFQNTIDREKVGVTCIGSSTTTPGPLSRIKRGWVPNLWNPLHLNAGTLATADTFGDTIYNPAASFRPLMSAAVNSTSWFIMEETDTWSVPSG